MTVVSTYNYLNNLTIVFSDRRTEVGERSGGERRGEEKGDEEGTEGRDDADLTNSCITTLASEVTTDMQASGIATDTLLCMEWMLDN